MLRAQEEDMNPVSAPGQEMRTQGVGVGVRGHQAKGKRMQIQTTASGKPHSDGAGEGHSLTERCAVGIVPRC